MKIRKRFFLIGSNSGFTLLEVMVGLILGTVIVGGVMGLMSTSLQYTQRLKEKSQIQPVLDAAAQEIFTNPEQALAGSLNMAAFPNSPPVLVFATRVEEPGFEDFAERSGQLHRVLLNCRGQMLEFSIIIPESLLD